MEILIMKGVHSIPRNTLNISNYVLWRWVKHCRSEKSVCQNDEVSEMSWQWISWIFGETSIFEMEQSEMN